MLQTLKSRASVDKTPIYCFYQNTKDKLDELRYLSHKTATYMCPILLGANVAIRQALNV